MRLIVGIAAHKQMNKLITDIRACTACAGLLPHNPRPVLQVSPDARILIAGQAPGRKVHESGIPFHDASGDRLRDWLGVTKGVFYDATSVAIVPMGFCYPGTGKSGDLPPRPECAKLWHADLLTQMRRIELKVIIGRYAIDWHLPDRKGQSITDVVKDWEDHLPNVIVVPHPSPRNNIWMKKNTWFEEDIIPKLQNRVMEILK